MTSIKHKLIAQAVAAAFALAYATGCTSGQTRDAAEWTGDRVADALTLFGKGVNKAVQMVGLDEAEDPWDLCVANPCTFPTQCKARYPDTFMVPQCGESPVTPQGSRTAVTPRQPVAGPAPTAEDVRTAYDATHRARGATATPPAPTPRQVYEGLRDGCVGMPQKDLEHCEAHALETLETFGLEMEDL